MNSEDAKRYADALDLVEKRRTAGTMTEGEALVWKQRLLDEMSEKPRPMWARILIGIFYAVLFLAAVRLVFFIVAIAVR